MLLHHRALHSIRRASLFTPSLTILTAILQCYICFDLYCVNSSIEKKWSSPARDVELMAPVRPPDDMVAAELLLTIQLITSFGSFKFNQLTNQNRTHCPSPSKLHDQHPDQ
ncbi:hypothetical protein E5676_scaffold675G00230 [Cucumis melo var. makuwa]|uniref:Uncharacterized protein n=1 Tax=Cucumis melo var. makuwa TaxID=1194695 RepID=A0A5D3C1R7_CUCMM|nr:hypothetical protein E5676_scaffold675G00230 [Cucumis melo var. makuwa]